MYLLKIMNAWRGSPSQIKEGAVNAGELESVGGEEPDIAIYLNQRERATILTDTEKILCGT